MNRASKRVEGASRTTSEKYLERRTQKRKMRINEGKSKIKRQKSLKRLNGEELEEVKEFKYLGSTVCASDSTSEKEGGGA